MSAWPIEIRVRGYIVSLVIMYIGFACTKGYNLERFDLV